MRVNVSVASCFGTHLQSCTSSSFVGNLSQLELLGSAPTNITCQIYCISRHSASNVLTSPLMQGILLHPYHLLHCLLVMAKKPCGSLIQEPQLK